MSITNGTKTIGIVPKEWCRYTLEKFITIAEPLGFELANTTIDTLTQPLSPETLFVNFLGYCSVPKGVGTSLLKPPEVHELIRTIVLPRCRNSFFVPLYQLLFEPDELININIQALSTYDIIRQLTPITGKMKWKHEVDVASYRLTTLLVDCMINIECDGDDDDGDDDDDDDDTRCKILNSHYYKVFRYNPRNQTTTSIVNRLIPIIRTRMILIAHKNNQMTSHLVARFGKIGMSGMSGMSDMSDVEIYETFIEQIGMTLMSNSKEYFRYYGSYVMNFLGIENETLLRRVLDDIKMMEHDYWIMKDDAIWLSEDALNILLLKTNYEKGRKIQKWFTDLKLLWRYVMIEYTNNSSEDKKQARLYSSTIDSNNELKTKFTDLTKENLRLKKENKELSDIIHNHTSDS